MTDIAAEVTTIIAKRMPVTKKTLQSSDRIDELGIDSIAAVELIFDLEEKYDVEIPFNSNAKLQFETVGEIVDAIKNLVNGKS